MANAVSINGFRFNELMITKYKPKPFHSAHDDDDIDSTQQLKYEIEVEEPISGSVRRYIGKRANPKISPITLRSANSMSSKLKPFLFGEFSLQAAFEPGLVDEMRRLLYEIEIQNPVSGLISRYVGKAEPSTRRGRTRPAGKRPRTDYIRNTNRCLAGRPYRKNNPEGFRKVHLALADAVRQNLRVTIRLLKNVAPTENIYDAEREMIRDRNADLND